MYNVTIANAPDLYLVRIQANGEPAAVRAEGDRVNAVTELPDLFGCRLRREQKKADDDE
jgi:hypothetical protein